MARRVLYRILHVAHSEEGIIGSVERRVVGYAHVLVDLRLDLRTEVEFPEDVRLGLDDTGLVVEAAGQVILYVLVSAADRDVVCLDRMAVVEHGMPPVGVAVVDPLVASVPEILDDPGTGRILGLVIDTGQQLGHVVVGVGRVLLACVGLPEGVHGVNGPEATGLVVGAGGGFLPAETAVVAHRRLPSLVGAGPGGDEDHSVCGTGSIDGGSRGILDDGDALDIVGVDPVKLSDGSVDEHQRAGAVDGGRSTDVERAYATRVTGRCADVQSRDRTLEHVGKVVGDPVLEVVCGHRGDGTRQVDLLLDAVADDHRLVQHLGVFLQDDSHL